MPNIGVQLYTVREPLAARPAETLKRLADIGYTHVEAFHDDVGGIAPLARECGLRVVSTHVSADVIGRTDALRQTALRQTFDALRAQDVEYVGTYMPYASCAHDASFWTALGERLNDAGRIARQAGLTFVYHNHAVELTRLPDGQLPDGQLPLDVLLGICDAALVSLELDVFWASIAGADPVALLQRLGPRVVLLHLKDKAANTPCFADDRAVPHAAFAEVGAGVLPMPAILAAAETSNIAYAFVEQDHTPGDPLVSLDRSLCYIRAQRCATQA